MYVKRLRLKCFDALNSRPCSGKCGECGYGVIESSAPQIAIVMGGLTTDRSVDHKLHCTGANQILDVGATFMDFEHGLNLKTSLSQGFCCSGRGRERKAKIEQTLGQTLVSFGLAKLATKNLPGALLVGGGAVVKSLYDRRRSRLAQRREGDRDLIEQAHRGDD